MHTNNTNLAVSPVRLAFIYAPRKEFWQAVNKIVPGMSKGVCAALFDVYYGKSPVSPAAKEGVAVGFAKRFYLPKGK